MTENGHRSAAGFRRETEWKTLPSGKEVELRRPDVADIIMANADKGDIPQPLVNQMLESLNTGQQVEARLTYEAEHLPGLNRFNKLLSRATVVWPVIVPDGVEPDYEAGQIEIADLDSTDQGWITRWVMGRSAAAASQFLKAEASGVGPESTGGKVRSTPKRAGGRKR